MFAYSMNNILAQAGQFMIVQAKYKEESGSLDDAVNMAVDECIKNDILADFLRKNRAEVVMTSIFEYNKTGQFFTNISLNK